MSDSASLQFTLLCVWLMCLLVATFLGYERGRWFTGLWLGLFFGPFGVVAAGFLLPHPSVEAERQHQIQGLTAALRQRDDAGVRERRRIDADMENFLSAVESQVAVAKSADDTATALRSNGGSSNTDAPKPRRPSDRSVAVAKLAEQLAGTPTPPIDGMLRGPVEPRADFSGRLRELARDLEGLAQIDALHADDLRRWVRWLETKSDVASAMKRRARS